MTTFSMAYGYGLYFDMAPTLADGSDFIDPSAAPLTTLVLDDGTTAIFDFVPPLPSGDLLITSVGINYRRDFDSVFIEDVIYFSDSLSAFVIDDINWITTNADLIAGIDWAELNTLDDLFIGAELADRIYAGPGDDELRGYDGADTLSGDDGFDTIFGGIGGDLIDGGFGDDDIFGYDGNDRIFGGSGFDLIYGELGSDIVFAEAGDDFIEGGPAADFIDGGTGSDWISYEESLDFVIVNLMGGKGKRADAAGDRFVSVENVIGSSGGDYVWGDGGANRIETGAGADRVSAFGGDDTVLGGDGDDKVDGGTGADLIDGGPGEDTLVFDRSESGVDIDLGTGLGSGGAAEGDTFAAMEHVKGSLHGDTLTGDEGTNILQGLWGDDVIHGGGGRDYLYGQRGDDRIVPGAGDDRIKGNLGADVFVFGRDDGFNSVRGFERGADRIELTEGASLADVTITRVSWGTRVDYGETTIALVRVTGAITEDHFILA